MKSKENDEFRAASTGKPSSKKQIRELEKQYHHEKPVMQYTPFSGRWIERLTPRQRAENAKTTDKRLFMMRRLQKQQAKAKTAMNNAANRRNGVDRRQRENGNGR